jgi:hypothetical protein
MAFALESGFDTVPSFATFRDLVRQDIGYFPNFSCEDVGLSGHRVRVFNDPPSAEILISEGALARYIRIGDILVGAMQRQSIDFVANCLCVETGGELLISNKLQGLALVAHGFKTLKMIRLSKKETLERAVRDSRDQSEVLPLVSLILPLAHEIGHLPQAQAFCPKDVMGNNFLETYRINYKRVLSFTGEFDYAASFSNKSSPLNLATLRQEVAADYFATSILSTLFAKTTIGQQYPISKLTTGLLMFPIAMAFESLSTGRERTASEIREVTLAMQCRYSLMIDSIRASIKSFFGKRPDREKLFELIDTEINRIDDLLYALQEGMWMGMRRYSAFAKKVASWDSAQVFAYAREATPDEERQINVANYISVLLDEIDPYPLSKGNEAYLRSYSNVLMTFDTAIIDGENVRLIRSPRNSGDAS